MMHPPESWQSNWVEAISRTDKEQPLKPKRWNTAKLAGYGAICGLLVVGIKNIELAMQGSEFIARYIGGLVGGAVGGALWFAAISGIRNYFAKA